jgi:DNA-directed RNA polymerase specialized sigma24 family protein
VCDRLAERLRQRRDAVVAMRDQGHSLRAIADALGIDTATVNSDLLATKTMGPWGRI